MFCILSTHSYHTLLYIACLIKSVKENLFGMIMISKYDLHHLTLHLLTNPFYCHVEFSNSTIIHQLYPHEGHGSKSCGLSVRVGNVKHFFKKARITGLEIWFDTPSILLSCIYQLNKIRQCVGAGELCLKNIKRIQEMLQYVALSLINKNLDLICFKTQISKNRSKKESYLSRNSE